MSVTVTLTASGPFQTKTTKAIFDDEDNSNIVRLENTCSEKICNHVTAAVVHRNELQSYLDGEKAQYAFPNLTPDEREAFFMSGLCNRHYDLLMGGM